MAAIVEDTYAEAFKSVFVEFLITARDRTWLDHAVTATVGNASKSAGNAENGSLAVGGRLVNCAHGTCLRA